MKSDNACQKCGKCCEVLVLPLPMSEIKNIAKDPSSDYSFALRNFTQISEEDTLKINPYLST